MALHPIRAKVLTSILTDPVICPWEEIAKACLPLLADTDLEIFLLHGFVAHPEASDAMIAELCLMQFGSWTEMGSVAPALLWKGIHEYTLKNKKVIEEAYEFVGDGFWAILGLDFAGLLDSTEKPPHKVMSGLCDTLSETSPDYADKKHKIESLQASQSNKEYAFQWFDNWLKQVHLPEKPCMTEADWRAFAQIAYWAKFRNIDLKLLEHLNFSSLEKITQTLPLDFLIDIICGLWKAFSDIELFSQQYAVLSPKIKERYRIETQSPYIEEKGTTLRAHFILPLEEDKKEIESKYKNIVHEATMQHVNLLGRLMPEFDAYGCQGYGHQVFDFMEHDESTKTAIPAWHFTPDWAREINGTARILADHFFRPKTWKDYCTEMFELRSNTMRCLDVLRKELIKHFRSKKGVVRSLSVLADTPLWQDISKQLARVPSFPLEALDPWGRTEEGNSKKALQGLASTEKEVSVITAYLQRYQAYNKANRGFWTGLSNFIDQVRPFLIVHAHLGKAKTSQEREIILKRADMIKLKIDHIHLPLFNLADALKALPEFQRLYRQHFAKLSDTEALLRLEQQETQTLYAVWSLWFFFANEPQRYWARPEKAVLAQLNGRMQAIRKRLEKTVQKLTTESLQFHCLGDSLPFEDKTAFWISIDSKKPIEVYTQTESLIAQIKKARGMIKLHSLEYYALHFQWENLVIVPLCRGKLLEPHVWSIPTYRLETNSNQDNGLSLIDQVPRQIDVKQLSQLGLSIWSPDLLQDAALFLRGIATLQVRLRHLLEISKLPDLDEIGRTIFQSYVESTQDNISKNTQQMIDAVTQLQQLIETETDGYWQQAEERFYIFSMLLPDEFEDKQTNLTTETLKVWQQRLASIQGEVFLIYLFWCGDLLNKVHNDF